MRTTRWSSSAGGASEKEAEPESSSAVRPFPASQRVPMTEPLQLLQRYGDPVLFVWVLVDQMGVPIPAVPMLIAAGALAGIGSANLTVAIGLAAGASLIADVFWYSLGRRRGHRTLAWLCALSLEPDSCVRRTETVFLARGAGALLFAKFLPGLNAVAAALAGIFGFGTSRFLLYAGAAVPYAIPGALRVAAEDIERRQSGLPRDREIVLYCT